ncbi:hypothetical protein N7468_010144 [Penicillium chermesinum]|uniref:Enoyl reductase (ER) domain-containing protein n=1 Tax=Penicillium chermesinum TaxID=63820 RepID=A0A9W9NC40_9EURO|nr:uncharacterized protein N7468_010144 [Penicillium chermesinum]KAJ5217136.1 hypothetical protein N7468_010144 [Penicillium chermesinum]
MSSSTMRALQLTRSTSNSPPLLRLTTLPIPPLKPGHALIRIEYTSIQPSDRLNAVCGFPDTTFPRVPGRDYSGVVVAISGSTRISEPAAEWWVGKHVYGTSGSSLGFEADGPHAEYCVVPNEALVEKPDALSAVQAATVGNPFTTAFFCLQRGRAKEGDVVLVLGANGSVGAAAVQIGNLMGCRVLTGMRREEEGPDVLGVDVIVDVVGDLELMAAGIEGLAEGGRYVWIAAPRGDVGKRVSFDIFQAYRRNLTLSGFNSGLSSVEAMAEALRSLGGWIAAGLLKAQDETAFKKVSLEEAIELGYEQTGKKVVIDLT